MNNLDRGSSIVDRRPSTIHHSISTIRVFFLVTCHLLLVTPFTWAKEKEAKADPQKQAFVQQVKQNLSALNFQEVTAAVLGGQYQKELNNLQQMQAIFCDTYKLEVAKFRQGKYRFDEAEGKFSEVEATKQ